jgi:hypothetical protein
VGSLLAVLFAGGSVFAAYWEMRAENSWNRRFEAFQMLRDFNSDVVPQAQRVQCVFPYHRADTVMDSTTAARIYNAPCDTPDYELRCNIMHLLNYAKAVCTACDLGIVDEKMVRQEYGPLFKRWLSAFHHFINCAHSGYGVKGTGPYDIIRKVVGAWG